jgi:hypothetical protein
MTFRLAFGPCSCRPPYRDPLQDLACSVIEARLQEWQPRLPADLDAVPAEHYEHEHVHGHWISQSIWKKAFENGSTIVAFGVLVHTWRAPTYIAVGVIGRLYVEGLLIEADGTVGRAPDELMWEFR